MSWIRVGLSGKYFPSTSGKEIRMLTVPDKKVLVDLIGPISVKNYGLRVLEYDGNYFTLEADDNTENLEKYSEQWVDYLIRSGHPIFKLH